MNAFGAVAAINCTILLMVTVVSVAGFATLGTSDGLWSLLALLFWTSTSSSKDEDEVDDKKERD